MDTAAELDAPVERLRLCVELGLEICADDGDTYLLGGDSLPKVTEVQEVGRSLLCWAS